jgi:hypothetical protein
MEVIPIALLVMVVVLSGLSQKRSNRLAESSAGRGGILATERRAAAAVQGTSALEQAFTHATLRCADGCAVLWRSSNPLAVNTPPNSISEPADRSIDYSKKVDALFQNHDGLRASHVGGDLAQFVYTASRAVHVAHVN